MKIGIKFPEEHFSKNGSILLQVKHVPHEDFLILFSKELIHEMHDLPNLVK